MNYNATKLVSALFDDFNIFVRDTDGIHYEIRSVYLYGYNRVEQRRVVEIEFIQSTGFIPELWYQPQTLETIKSCASDKGILNVKNKLIVPLTRLIELISFYTVDHKNCIVSIIPALDLSITEL